MLTFFCTSKRERLVTVSLRVTPCEVRYLSPFVDLHGKERSTKANVLKCMDM